MLYRFTLLVFVSALTAAAQPAQDAHRLLAARCFPCHSPALKQAGLDLTTRDAVLRGGATGPALRPADPDRSLLIRRVSGAKPPRMPLAGAPLNEAETATLRDWIARGAPYPVATASTRKWQAPLAPRAPDLPPGDGHPIDRLLRYTGPVVADAVFARRAWLDLWGLLPTPEQLDAFLRDSSPRKRAALAGTLLAARDNYAAHWITFWNDLLRNDEGVIYHGERKSITPWLWRALSSNLPYDRMLAALLNPQAQDSPEGFLLGVTWRGTVSASELPPMQAAQNSAQVFLGINLKCNSCHDSFISTWKLKDAYGLAAMFSTEPLELVRCDVPTGKRAEPSFLFPELGPVNAALPPGELREEAVRLFLHPRNGRTARTFVNRVWAQLLGRGIVPGVDDMAAEPAHPDLLDWLAADFVAHGWDVQRLLASIMNSRAYQSPTLPDARRLSAEQFADAISSLTGDWRAREVPGGRHAEPVREWRFKSSPLTRALGRPIRDQVTTVRQTQPTTLQALEMVNGSTLAEQLRRGAERLLGVRKPAPAPAFDSGLMRFRQSPLKIDVELEGAARVWLLFEDVDSYDPARIKATLAFGGREEELALPASNVIATGGAARFQATLALNEASRASDVSAAVRVFVYTAEPDRQQLVALQGEPPVPRPSLAGLGADAITRRLFRHALARDPAPRELAVARQVLGAPVKPAGLEDLLWMVLMSPEFQYIR
jgi:hypothetical protein